MTFSPFFSDPKCSRSRLLLLCCSFLHDGLPRDSFQVEEVHILPFVELELNADNTTHRWSSLVHERRDLQLLISHSQRSLVDVPHHANLCLEF